MAKSGWIPLAMQRVWVQDAFSVASNIVADADSYTHAGTEGDWEPSTALLRSLVVTAAPTIGASPAPWPINTESFSTAASTLPSVSAMFISPPFPLKIYIMPCMLRTLKLSVFISCQIWCKKIKCYIHYIGSFHIADCLLLCFVCFVASIYYQSLLATKTTVVLCIGNRRSSLGLECMKDIKNLSL